MTGKTYSPIFREIPFESPVSVYEKLRTKESFLFESVKGPENIAGYSFIGIEPYLVLRVKEGNVEIDFGCRKTLSNKNPLQRLRELFEGYSQIPVDFLPPFQGGAAGMLGYDFVQYIEKLPKNSIDDLNIPDAHFFMIDRLIAFDHKKNKCWIIVCPAVRSSVLGYSELNRK